MAFAINGAALVRVTEGQWLDDPLSQALDGVTPLPRWKRHTLRASVTTAAEYDTLAALEGQRVSLTTTKYDARNTFTNYYQVIFEKLSGTHSGPVFTGVQAEFLVRL